MAASAPSAAPGGHLSSRVFPAGPCRSRSGSMAKQRTASIACRWMPGRARAHGRGVAKGQDPDRVGHPAQLRSPLHQAGVTCVHQPPAQLITCAICIIEAFRLLGGPGDPRFLAAQNHLHGSCSRAGIEAINLLPEDDVRIADLSLVMFPERLDGVEIFSVDRDVHFDRGLESRPSAASRSAGPLRQAESGAMPTRSSSPYRRTTSS